MPEVWRHDVRGPQAQSKISGGVGLRSQEEDVKQLLNVSMLHKGQSIYYLDMGFWV